MNFPQLIDTFANNLLPILLISAAGYLLGRTLHIDSRPLGRVVFYIFSPVLVFNLLINMKLDSAEIVATMAYTVALCAITGLIGLVLGNLFHLPRKIILAIVLTSAFGNTGNYGLPLVSFAFGKDALAFASLFFVTTSILFNTAGVLVASLGHMDLKTAFLGLFRVPGVYAVLLAFGLRQFQITMPVPLERTIQLAADGSIPLMIILLGVELSRVTWSHSMKPIGLSVALRLVAGPVVGLLLALAFGYAGYARFGVAGAAQQGVVTESAMPAAVTTTVLASEYGLDVSLVTAMVFVGTILSPITLTPLITYLAR